MNIYAHKIIEHYKTPKNYGVLDKYNISNKENNLSCGDSIKVFLLVSNNVVEKISFLGQGCAISQATMSLLTEKIKNKSIDEIKKMSDIDVYELINIKISKQRTKCALLPLLCVINAIKLWEKKEKISYKDISTRK